MRATSYMCWSKSDPNTRSSVVAFTPYEAIRKTLARHFRIPENGTDSSETFVVFWTDELEHDHQAEFYVHIDVNIREIGKETD